MSATQPTPKRRWRFSVAPSGRRVVRDFLDSLTDEDAASVIATLKDVLDLGLSDARHLRGEIYEVRVPGRNVIYRVRFATEGRAGQVLLALEAFSKKTQRTPPRYVDNAEARLRDWRERGAILRREQGRG